MIESREFARRRQQLMRIVGSDGICIVPAAPERVRNNDSHYPYRQDSDFHYLTGFPEPEALLVAWRTGRNGHRAELFVRPRDPARETWDGRRFGVRGAMARFGVDALAVLVLVAISLLIPWNVVGTIWQIYGRTESA